MFKKASSNQVGILVVSVEQMIDLMDLIIDKAATMLMIIVLGLIIQDNTTMLVVLTDITDCTRIMVPTNNRLGIMTIVAHKTRVKVVTNLAIGPVIFKNPLTKVFQNFREEDLNVSLFADLLKLPAT